MSFVWVSYDGVSSNFNEWSAWDLIVWQWSLEISKTMVGKLNTTTSMERNVKLVLVRNFDGGAKNIFN